jgi:hypothetical protein
MTDILIDLTSSGKGKRYKVNVCHYCNHDKFPNGKPIDPTSDKHAQKTAKGDWKCGACVYEGTKKLLEMNRRGMFNTHIQGIERLDYP